ncbi:hypothetical protein [Paenarthrobacter ureafaciens]|uniref:hypothetical protein n=1 Tax=Paenarthrobacter ureafaciens TaxID=37931 RepID=UPI001FB1EA3D|nr:hypothetical protein [Paenarthrobacter ureafaciens]UOD81499.1 hypothetical protein MQZ73_00960 [Paenarthrobacter ureafaciens]WNZ04153.1 hypothetical protein PVT25_00945 [Paenarthrobacter ureafaciens]
MLGSLAILGQPAKQRPQDMGFDRNEPEQSRGLQEVLTAGHISTESLWLHYVSIGGMLGVVEVEAYVKGLLSVPTFQQDVLAAAANELSDGPFALRAPFAIDFDPPATTPVLP